MGSLGGPGEAEGGRANEPGEGHFFNAGARSGTPLASRMPAEDGVS
jgi:hypothetical protein